MKIKGTVRKEDLEGGVFVFEADDGNVYALPKSDGALCKDGQKVEIDGDVDQGSMGIDMTGPTLKVKSWKKR